MFPSEGEWQLPAGPHMWLSGRPRNIHAQGVTNVHLEWSQDPQDDADIIMTYGSCDQSHPSEAHHEVGRFLARSYPELP